MNETTTTSISMDFWSMLTVGGPIGMTVIVILVVMSLLTWAVIVEKWMALMRLQRRSEIFIQRFWESKSLSDLHAKIKRMEYSPAREIFRAGYNEVVRLVQASEKRGKGRALPFDTVKRVLVKTRSSEETGLTRHLSVLSIAASACPFIGLFGTVVGIIRAFHDIGQSGSSSLAAVAPGISEALIATALGLAAAIPAVIFYNIFVAKARNHLVTLEGFSVDFLNILERHFNVGSSDETSSV